jgi:hypothetical protein
MLPTNCSIVSLLRVLHKASLNGEFHIQVSSTSDFENSVEEFYEDETLSAPIKLLSSLTSLIRCHISIFNAMKL